MLSNLPAKNKKLSLSENQLSVHIPAFCEWTIPMAEDLRIKIWIIGEYKSSCVT